MIAARIRGRDAQAYPAGLRLLHVRCLLSLLRLLQRHPDVLRELRRVHADRIDGPGGGTVDPPRSFGPTPSLGRPALIPPTVGHTPSREIRWGISEHVVWVPASPADASPRSAQSPAACKRAGPPARRARSPKRSGAGGRPS
jgi:hypothetical protein